jgi:hypothetical protein
MTSAGSLRTPIEAALVGWLLDRPPTTARLPVGALTREEKATELRRLQARKAMEAAYEAELVLGLADDTPDTLDPPPDQPGARKGSWAPEPELPGVSQFFPTELSVVLNCGRRSAAYLAHRAWTYRAQLPATWTALAEGVLDDARAKVLVDVLQHTTPAISRAVEARLLLEAPQLFTGGCGPGRWRCCWSWMPPRWTPAARKRSGRPTCALTSRTPRACPPWPPICPPRCRPSAWTPSTGSRRCSRPTATPARSGSCARRCWPT